MLKMGGPDLNDGGVITLCLAHVGHVVLQLEAREVVIDVLQNEVEGHEGAGGCSLSFHH